MARTETAEERARRRRRSSGYRARVPKGTSWHQLRFAYHEAGHAVLAHVFGRCLALVSIDPDRVHALDESSARGCCHFDIFAEADHHVRAWTTERRNRNQIAILLGGICAGVYAVDEHGWQLLHWKLGAEEDLALVEQFLDQLDLSPARRKWLRKHQEQIAIDRVRELWPAIVKVAQALVDQGTLMGWEVHRLIEPYLKPIQADWRTEARW